MTVSIIEYWNLEFVCDVMLVYWFLLNMKKITMTNLTGCAYRLIDFQTFITPVKVLLTPVNGNVQMGSKTGRLSP